MLVAIKNKPVENNNEYKKIQEFTNRIQYNPKDADAYLKRGILYSESKSWDLAISDYSQSINLNPGEINAFYNRGNCFLQKENYSKAIEDYSIVLYINPSDVEALNNRAVAHERSSKFQEALIDYRKAIELEPNVIFPRIGLGNTLIQIENYQEAISVFSEAIAISDKVEKLFFLRGCSQYELGELPKAKEDFQKAKSLGRKDADLSLYLGKIYFRLLDPDNAITELNNAVEYSSRKKESLCYRLFSHFLINFLFPKRFNQDAATSDMQVIVKSLGEMAQQEFLKGFQLIIDQKYDEAVHVLTQLHDRGFNGIEAGIYYANFIWEPEKYIQQFESYFNKAKEDSSAATEDSNQDAYQKNPSLKTVNYFPDHMENSLPAAILLQNGDIFLSEAQLDEWHSNSCGNATMDRIPFSEFEGNVKFIRTFDLSAQAKAAMDFTFTQFFREEVNLPSDEEKIRGLDNREKAFNYRRYAGGSDLPRGRYYSICDSQGDDGSTLAYELRHYYDPKVSGEVDVYDLADKRNYQFLYRKYAYIWSDGSFPNDGILLVYKSRHGCPNPFHTYWSRITDKDDTTIVEAVKEFPFPVRFNTKKVKLSNVIDLRIPEVQEWLVKSLQEGIDKTHFVYRTDEDTFLSSQCFLIKGKKPVDFYDLLPSLLCFYTGGTPVTEAIARWLRNIGTKALIYPSARANAAVEMKNGEMIHSEGWCLVDYTDSEPPDMESIFRIFQPDEWGSQYYSVKTVIYSENSPSYGSWKIIENTESKWLERKYESEMYYQSSYVKEQIEELKKQYSLPTLRNRIRGQSFSIIELKAMLNSYGSTIGMNLQTTVQKAGSDDVFPVGQILAKSKENHTNKITSKLTPILVSESWYLYTYNKEENLTIILCPICNIIGELRNPSIKPGGNCPNCYFHI